jgi:hypothetical protein
LKDKREPRVPKRIACDVDIAGLRCSGLVLNVSPKGLFIQTNAQASPRQDVSIRFTPPHDEGEVQLRGVVVWQRSVPRQLVGTARGGLGVRITEASENFYSFLAKALHAEGVASEAEPEAELEVQETQEAQKPAKRIPPKKPSFRVRVSQKTGSRSRYVVVTANDPGQAGRKALREVGKDEWEVLEVRLA